MTGKMNCITAIRAAKNMYITAAKGGKPFENACISFYTEAKKNPFLADYIITKQQAKHIKELSEKNILGLIKEMYSSFLRQRNFKKVVSSDGVKELIASADNLFKHNYPKTGNYRQMKIKNMLNFL